MIDSVVQVEKGGDKDRCPCISVYLLCFLVREALE